MLSHKSVFYTVGCLQFCNMKDVQRFCLRWFSCLPAMFFKLAHNEPLGFVDVPKGVFNCSSECVKGEYWENVVRKQRWFPDCRRSRAVIGKNCPEDRFFSTFPRYTRFGTKLTLIFGFTKLSQIQNQLYFKPSTYFYKLNQ